MNSALDFDFADFDAGLQRFVDAMQDVSKPPMRDGIAEAGEAFAEYQVERFDSLGSGGSFNGDSWVPLANVTVRERESLGFGERPSLVRLGNIRDALEPGGADHQEDWASDGVSHGVDNPIASYQHFGTNRIPARPIVGEPDDAIENRVHEILTETVTTAILSLYG